MKKFTDYTIFESAIIADLEARLPEDWRSFVKKAVTNLGPKATNALYLTMVFASKRSEEIQKDAKENVIPVIETDYQMYLNSILNLLDLSDKHAFADYKDGEHNANWLLYKTYLAKTIAKEVKSDDLYKFNLYLRTFKNAWEQSWKLIEEDVNKMHSDASKQELESTPVKTDEITNLEQTSAVEDAIKKEDTLLKDLIKRAGLDEKKLAAYVNLVIEQSFKTIDDTKEQPYIIWKKKVANGAADDNNFILGISAMICGAFITGDKNTIKEVLNYLDTKSQEELRIAKKNLFKY